MYNHSFGSHPDCSYVWAYGVCIREASCSHFTKIPRIHQCDFVRDTDDCVDSSAFIQYMDIFACTYNTFEGQIYLGLSIVMVELLILFLVLGTTADNFFAPTLCAVSNMLGLSENLAGVTLLAFGNASPDIFTSLAGATTLGPELVECQLLGGGIFVTTIVAACILLTKSFYAIPIAFVRDTLFYMMAIIWFRHISGKEHLRSFETACLIVLYIIYVVVVVLDAVYRKKKDKRVSGEVITLVDRERRLSVRPLMTRSEMNFVSRRASTLPSYPPAFVSPTVQVPPPNTPRRRSAARTNTLPGLVVQAERLNVLNNAGMRERVHNEREGNAKVIGLAVDGETFYVKQPGLWEDFLNEVIPIDDEDWNASGACGRFIIIVKAPIIYVLKYVIPVVDQGSLSNGWCKLLNSFHCVIAPMFLSMSLQFYSFPPVVYIPIYATVFLASLGFAIFVFKTSKVGEAPKYHMVFAVMGFITSMNMIYTVAHELVFLLSVMGYILNVSIATLAMTFLAWGNSMGDVVANTALARAGYPRMAWAGCFGSPLLSALLGAGMSLTFLVESRGKDHVYTFHAKYSGLISNCFFFLVLSLGSSLLIIPAMHFQCRRSYATFLIFIYGTFISFSVMCEAGLIHPLGL